MKAKNILWGSIEGEGRHYRCGFVGGREGYRLYYGSPKSFYDSEIWVISLLNKAPTDLHEVYGREDEAYTACQKHLQEYVDWLQKELVSLTKEETNDNNSN